MRIDAYAPGNNCGWLVWHAEQCRQIPDVVWVDDQTSEWCQYVRPWRTVGGAIARTIHKARRILILPERKTIIINPVADDTDQGRAVDVGVPESVAA